MVPPISSDCEISFEGLIALIDHAGELYFKLDGEGHIQEANGFASSTLGVPNQELAGQSFSNFFPELTADRLHKEFQSVPVSVPLILNTWLQRDSSSQVKINARLVKFVRDGSVCYLCLARDVSNFLLADMRYHTLVEHACDALLLCSEDGILLCNQATVKLLRCPNQASILLRDITEFFPTLQYNGERSIERWKKELELGRERDAHHFDWVIKRFDGTLLEVEISLTHQRFEEKPVLLLSLHDITERKHHEKLLEEMKANLEDRMQERTAELLQSNSDLERSNQDLQQFAYVASHDLQEPLRTISSFCSLLQNRYEGHLDERADRWIRFIVDGAERMRNLIEDLLEYSRVEGRARPFVPTDANLALKQAVHNLGKAILESNATIHAPKLPTVLADVNQLTQLFQNLIGNALKFRQEVPPVIKIECTLENNLWKNYWVFSVKDNGIGIAPSHQEQIFQIFRRLHTIDEYNGTGIGLAVCRKIVARHGGKIWVESVEGEGSTFYFAIPFQPRGDRGSAALPALPANSVG
ncbi:PAS domain-containing sensor histidine kinase [Planctomycetales bacterium 10988]|nr:PAS domain-containing sensor histidine kinase [Planctomycetales bacterium 10988]